MSLCRHVISVRVLLAIAVVSAGGILGCKGKNDTPKPTEATNGSVTPPSASVPAAAPPVVDEPPVKDTKDPRFAGLSIFDRLNVEKGNRPNIEPKVETVFEKITKLDIELQEKKQIAAWPVSARYCEKAQTKHDVHIVVCEYDNGELATKGVAAASVANKHLPRREVTAHKSSWVSVMQAGETKEAEADAKKIKAMLKTL